MNANLGALAAQVPWWGKIAAKMILGRLPVDYRTWKRLRLFEQGTMEEPAYAYGVFKKHFARVRARRILDEVPLILWTPIRHYQPKEMSDEYAAMVRHLRGYL